MVDYYQLREERGYFSLEVSGHTPSLREIRKRSKKDLEAGTAAAEAEELLPGLLPGCPLTLSLRTNGSTAPVGWTPISVISQ